MASAQLSCCRLRYPLVADAVADQPAADRRWPWARAGSATPDRRL